MSDLAVVTEIALRVVGSGLVLSGLAHAGLGRALGWSAESHREDGALSALVVRLHVGFVGLFLVVWAWSPWSLRRACSTASRGPWW